MIYERIAVPEALREYVSCGWYAEGDSSATFKAVADGCPGIMFQQADGGTFLNRTKKLATVFLYGQTVKPIELTSAGRFRMTGLYFYPHAMKTIFEFNASELTDTCLDLTLLPDALSKNLAERLLNTASHQGQFDILFQYLTGIIGMTTPRVDNIISCAIRHLANSRGRVLLKDLHKDFEVSPRTFERRFTQHVGIRPKLFARICRLQATLRQLKHNGYQKLSDVAFDNGYADQSHFIRTFREFVNLSPAEYREQSSQFVPPVSLR